MIDIRVYPDKEEAISRARKALGAELFRVKDLAVLLLLSGGSAFKILEGLRSDMLPENMMIGMLDERYSADPAVNNFAQFLDSEFYKAAGEQGALFLDSQVNPDEEPLEEYALGLEEALQDWKQENPNGKVIITQGMGVDGHTAGVMPYPEDPAKFAELFDETDRWMVGYDAGEKNSYPKRVTVTFPFLRDVVDFSLVYISGEEKRDALRKVWDEEGSISETPARVIREMKQVTLVTDIDLNN